MGDMGQTHETARGSAVEEIWAMLRENARQQKETERQMKETDRKIGKLGNRFGELVEHLVLPNIREKFKALNYTFTKTGSDMEFFDRGGKALTEADIWLENGEFVMVVEIKSRLRKRDVEEHVQRMGKLRSYFDERRDERKLLGAVAAAVVPNGLREYVPERGFYLLEQSGDTMRITAPEGFKPRVW